MTEIKGEDAMTRCFDPDLYWEMRGGEEYLATLREDHQNVLSVEKLFFRWLLAEFQVCNLLDFGCGTGTLFDVWQKIPNVHAYDRSLSQIEVARKLSYPYDITHGNGTDRTKTPYRNEQFDLVAACEVLPAVIPDEIEAMILELHRICRAHLGLVVTTPFQSEVEWYFSYDYNKLLNDLFEIRDSIIVAPYRFIWATRRIQNA